MLRWGSGDPLSLSLSPPPPSFLTSYSYIVFPFCSYNIEQEQKLATETTVLVESYTVSATAPRLFSFLAF